MTQTKMAAEIAEIPQAASRFLGQASTAISELAAALRMRQPGFFITVARGSSDHAATYLKYAVELAAGIPVASVGPSIASIYRRPLKVAGAACIGISQSGQSPDIVEMMRSMDHSGALTIAITNDADSPMARSSTFCLPLHAGPERSVAATKTFVNSVLAGLALLAEWQQDAALREAVGRLPESFAEAISLDWAPLEARLVRAQSAYVVGRGPAFAIASECALKLKETCGVHAEAYSAAEVLHGPSAIVKAEFPVLALAVEDAAQAAVAATAAQFKAQGAVVFLTGMEASGMASLPAISGLHPLIAPLVLVVSFYAFVESLARRRGLDPDAPPYLRKITETV